MTSEETLAMLCAMLPHSGMAGVDFDSPAFADMSAAAGLSPSTAKEAIKAMLLKMADEGFGDLPQIPMEVIFP